MRLFGWTITVEGKKARRRREMRESIASWSVRPDPWEKVAKEIRDLSRNLVAESKKTRHAMLCPSVAHASVGGKDAPVRCRLPRGHSGEHYGNGAEWDNADEVAEVVG